MNRSPAEETIQCPKCHAPNRPGAKFCAQCRAELTPLSTDNVNVQGTFQPRSLPATFGGQIIAESLIHSSEQQHGYKVSHLAPDTSIQITQCPNPACGAIAVFNTAEAEQFCIHCKTRLTVQLPALEIFETRQPPAGTSTQIAQLQLSHPYLRPPLLVFQDAYNGETRYCTLLAQTTSLPAQIERRQVLEWAEGLMDALNYLHQNQVTFGGRIQVETFKFADGKAVIANFATAQTNTSERTAQQADLRALASQLYRWLTGESQYTPNSGLSPALDLFFQTALSTSGFVNATAMLQGFRENTAAEQEARKLDYHLGKRTDVGKARDLNEDSLYTIQSNKYLTSVPTPIGVYVVADGMGGHAAGEVASGIIVDTVAQAATKLLTATTPLTPAEYRQWITQTIQQANQLVFNKSKQMGSDMGSTVVLAVLEGQYAHIGHVGDSRAYRINAKGITPLTTDHSLVERLIATQQITREEAKVHPQRNVIYRTIGDKPSVDVDTATHTLASGDHILLCSDGLNGMVSDEFIRQIVMKPGISSQQACDDLVAAANAAGGDDNISVILVKVEAI